MATQAKQHFKSSVLFTRVGDRTMKRFDRLAGERGLGRSEAMRQIIEAWMRQPETLPIGLQPEVKSIDNKEG